MQNTLSKVGLQWYRTLRTALVLIFLGVVVFVVVKTVFPNGGGYFDFKSYGSGKNTLADPRYEDGTPVVKGALKKEATMILNASASGDFSRADIAFSGRGEAGEDFGTISLVQAYRAYLYPVGEPVVCPREGSLVMLGGMYAIVSKGHLRLFASENDVVQRGYSREQLASFSQESLLRCPRAGIIEEEEKTIPGMIVKTEEGFFQLLDGEWVPFVSDSAFRSKYREEDVFPVLQEVFSEYPVSENPTGFLDGTLVSYGESVYVVSGDTLRPIDSVDTFLAKGYMWENVIPLNGEEFGMYTRGKLYTKREPHPNGTIFIEEKTERMYLVENGKKREVVSPELRVQFSPVHPILASVVDLGGCFVRSRWFSYGCTIDWAGKERGVGAEYQLTYKTGSPVTLNSLEVVFSREKNVRNWNLFLTETIGKLKSRYPFLS